MTIFIMKATRVKRTYTTTHSSPDAPRGTGRGSTDVYRSPGFVATR